MNAVNNVWAQGVSSEFLTLPSGQTCWAKRIGIQEVLSAGVSSELDILTRFVQDEHLSGHNKSQKEKDKELEKVMKDPDVMKGLIMLVDRVVPLIVTTPSVHCHYKVLEDGKSTKLLSKQDRQQIKEESGVDYIYTDRIGMEDKMFLFQWTTGSQVDPLSFRSEPSASMEDVGVVQTVPSQSKRPTRRRKR